MKNRLDPPPPDHARLTVLGLIDRIIAADLDPVQIASMNLHLSHLMRARNDGVSFEVDPAMSDFGILPTRHRGSMVS